MSDINLRAEMDIAGRSVRQLHIDRIRFLGVSLGTIAELGREDWAFGASNCEDVGGGLYQPLPGGPAHIVVPVREDGGLVDLCAFRSTQPDRWLMRRGEGWCLGADWHLADSPVYLFASPLEWLRGGGQGLCVLDWDDPRVWQLAALEEIICSDPALARLLERTLRRPVRLPTIRTMETADVA